MTAKTIGIISIKGGVGKTSVVSALGAALANNFGKKVLLVDGNFSAPNLGLHLGLINPEVTLHHVLSDKADIKDAVYESEYGFHVIPGAAVYGNVNPFKLKSKLKSLQKYYDIILIDSSPTLNNEILSAIIASDDLYIVTTPDHVSLSTALKAVKAAREKKNPIKGVILNKVYWKNFELNIKEIEEACDCKVFAVLPHEIQVLEALSESYPYSLQRFSVAGEEIKSFAGALIGEKYPKESFWRKMITFMDPVTRQELNRQDLLKEA